MAYQIDLSASLGRSLAAVAREQLERALLDLEASDPSSLDERVHDARKCLKKTRALLRLVRPGLPQAAFRRENARLRDAARSLSRARDRAATLECLARMKRDRPSLTGSIDALERLLAHAGQAEGTPPARELEPTRALLRAAHRRLPELIAGHVATGTLRRGLRDSHRRGRRALRRARREPSVEHFHEWRKRVKDHWYHLRLFAPTWPSWLGAQIAELEKLSELLGDEHDLEVVRQRVLALQHRLSPFDAETLLRAIERRTERDRRAACALGTRVYAERAGAFARRLCAYLSAPDLDD